MSEFNDGVPHREAFEAFYAKEIERSKYSETFARRGANYEVGHTQRAWLAWCGGARHKTLRDSGQLMRLEHVTRAGQIQEGDNLIILDNRGEIHVEKAKVTIRPGVVGDRDGEEIVVRKMRNIYFITDMYLKGKSWVRECHIVKAQCDVNTGQVEIYERRE